ncbi:aminoglycoside phosphotransferase family protein [Brachybacterium sp. FME24]|uniref:aminoglycoside phosphotransferase family protein n=1 Tax=Brachybacterium sp. FME24 TaxID=2742605 RepID=UPI0018696C9F|nr:aminoglycoside phosphotransferase family protein [Brachybacterium sp. FME24]
MQPLLAIEPTFRNRLLRHDPASAPWLEALPGHFVDVCARWNLWQSDAPRYGGTSIVIPVHGAPEGEAALKIVSPLADPATENLALAALAGHGVVRLFRFHEESRALLLERLDGPALSEHNDRFEVARIAGAVARTIASVPAPPDAPRLCDTSRRWLPMLQEQHAQARSAGNALPEATFHRAARIVEGLTAEASTTLTHGDLSLENILRRDDGVWIAIDPGYLCAPVEYEAHTILRGLLAALMASADPRAALRDVIAQFCEAAQADAARAEELSFARFVASFYWESQHEGDPADVERLRRAVEVTT